MTPLLLAAFLMAADRPPPVNPQIDYQGFQQLAARVASERAKRRVTLARFKQMAATGEAIILDARSADAFAQGHIAGAINLPLTDFTAPALPQFCPTATGRC